MYWHEVKFCSTTDTNMCYINSTIQVNTNFENPPLFGRNSEIKNKKIINEVHRKILLFS